MTDQERKKEVKESIFKSQNRVAEIKIFYSQVSKNEQSQKCEKNEIDATIEGTIHRLKILGVSKEEIDKVDFHLNDPTTKFIIWCKQKGLEPKQYKSLELYQKEFGML